MRVSEKKGKDRGQVNLAISRNRASKSKTVKGKGVSGNHMREFQRRRARLGLGVSLTWPYLRNGAS